MFSILCDVIFQARLQGKLEIDHSWEQKGYEFPNSTSTICLYMRVTWKYPFLSVLRKKLKAFRQLLVDQASQAPSSPGPGPRTKLTVAATCSPGESLLLPQELSAPRHREVRTGQYLSKLPEKQGKFCYSYMATSFYSLLITCA